MKTKNTRLFKKTYLFLLVSIIVPCLLVSIVSGIITFVTANHLADKIIEYSTETMLSISKNADVNLDSLKNIAQVLSAQPEVRNALSDSTLVYSPELGSAIEQIDPSNLHIINTFIFDKDQRTVCSNDGEFNSWDYFTNQLVYNDYSSSYWNNFTFFSTEAFRVLSPGELKTQNGTYNAIPVVFRKIGSFSQKRYLVFNVELTSLLPVNTETSSTQFYILNKFTNDIFSLSPNYDTAKINDPAFLDYVLSNPNADFEYTLPDGKYFVSTSSNDASIIGYTYISIVSKGSVYGGLIPYTIILILINVLTLLTVIVLATRNARKIFVPIKNVWLSLAKKEHTASTNNLLYEIVALSAESKKEREYLYKILPHAQQNYLVNLLNNPDSIESYDSDTKKFLEESLNFQYHYFSVILLQLSPASNFYDRFSIEEYEVIKTGLYNIVYEMFSDEFDSYILPTQNNVLDIVLNMERAEQNEKVRKLLKDLLNYLKNDFEYITLSIGMSKSYHDIPGLKAAHAEALNNFVPYVTPEQQPVIDLKFKSMIVFTNADESALFSALSSFDKNRITETIDNFLQKNQDFCVRELKMLYNYILNTILKFIHINKISYMDEMLDFEITNKILSQPLAGIRNEINQIIDYVSSLKHTKTNFDDLYTYIKENCNSSELSLKILADVFSMSQSSITRMIQDNTKFSFKELLSNIRIENAKELLKNTDLPIDKICEMTGFSNKRTFFRVFKMVTGTTPGEYRKG
ncbi:helix-turn-helix domain-containing protein [Ructibacterium gallinarum]|uniref:AraC family transcriptional regulator n=1 Tax=Ructibacterium gallinarum TaxID=2779355 RepID=A0A9D5R844_9FIRM|nr:helix-turn-helix domain-containing protein [Ructibacterium gallinarum]MBE5039580.1 AraC family transcriptional regulator [Ructibacterium gallinarum]